VTDHHPECRCALCCFEKNIFIGLFFFLFKILAFCLFVFGGAGLVIYLVISIWGVPSETEEKATKTKTLHPARE
jgi:hypothetical protein